MARAAAHSARPLVIAIGVLLTLALLPARALWWVSDVADIVALPLAPLNDISNAVRLWLRPGHDPLSPRDPLGAASEELEAVIIDRDVALSRWHAERLRTEELLRQLEDFRLAEQFDRGGAFDPLRADIVGRSPDGLRGPVRLNVGSHSGVVEGAVAVFRGAHLVGRVVGEPAALSCLLLPLGDRSIPRIHGAVLPDPEPADPSPAPIDLLLTPTGDGDFLADAGRDDRLAIGDEVVANDPAWPDSARGMIVGAIQDIEPRDDQPLRVRLRIRPRYDVHDLRSVIVKVEPARPAAESSNGAKQ